MNRTMKRRQSVVKSDLVVFLQSLIDEPFRNLRRVGGGNVR